MGDGKVCSKCGKFRTFDLFTKLSKSKDGLSYSCKICGKRYRLDNKTIIKERKKEYQQKNSDIIKVRKNKYYEANKAVILEKQRKYYLENIKYINDRSAKYYANNSPTIKEAVKKYASENKDLISKRNSAALRSGAKFTLNVDRLTVDEGPKLSEDGIHLEVLCKYCGIYFIPSKGATTKRIEALNGATRKYPKGFKKATSREVNPLLRQMCFERDNWTCQTCGKTINEVSLHCHHIEGYAQNPLLGNDLENVITLCKDCHAKVHKLPGCNYYELQCK